ncbi:tRNA (guanosine(46)-N7)-methyltransferase TrmB [Synechococcus sp. Cruz-9H2]|nr:tRNA (guanosine(46)-N7)-methyltransferase TrmB [Synechococcus sp. Cruz-9H2]MCP9843152.1 tRNA (guanosine(46)-N7)-methyltransferase TrmB [Synechococcus sp. Edmonson 11F2]MCP9854897.1 tRNA (guanosine(46)-N7)-methyltransferase TrmB [Synechococcus sp. Cruz-9C9]MCP9862632.1 tRNA (guanosine(46)-N7)-methyltransferase TrmB [Synechococcus sp. Cruz-7E5]MCP9870269.1 tRNA (guanosine(46)-N7)-methyltransferase TrmB [Synechococcus sp. Cruz-7B9]
MVRQHVNPLSRVHQQPLVLPPLIELFARPEQPLHLDIGSARGRFLLAMAPLQPEWNFLGVEIRRPLVEAAERDRQAQASSNLSFLFCNANVSLLSWLRTLPAGSLQRVTIQFPDPWFKSRHHKRRVLQPDLLQALAASLPEGGELFLQSDVTAVIEPMVALTEASGWFLRPPEDGRPWRGDNPLPVATERERIVLSQGLPVYRVLYRRGHQACLHPQPPLEPRSDAAHNPSASPAGS